MRFLQWAWATYQTLSFYQWLVAIPAAAGPVSAAPIVGVIYDWPVWVHALISAGVALVWLPSFHWLLNFLTKPKEGAISTLVSNVGRDAASASGTNSQAIQSGGGPVTAALGDVIITVNHNYYYGSANQSETPEEKEVGEVTQEQSGFNQNIYGNDGIVIGQLENLIIQGQPAPKLSLSETVTTQLSDGTYQSKATLTSNVPSAYPRLTIVAKANSLESIKMMPHGGVIQSYIEGTVGEAKFVSGANIVCPCVITTIARENEQVTLEITDWNPLGG